MKTAIIGIDPGDRWTGVAQLLIERESIVLATFVIDGARRTLNEIVNMALLDGPAFTIGEEFRARPIGHQRFGANRTSRLLGALEYRTVQLKGQWSTVPAGTPGAVWAYPIGRLLKHWKERWPRESDSRWEHAISAWRVICTSLMRVEPSIHRLIQGIQRSSMWLDENTIPSNVDLIAPFASWPRR